MITQSLSTQSNLLIGNHLLKELEAEKKKSERLQQEVKFLMSELDSDTYNGRTGQ